MLVIRLGHSPKSRKKRRWRHRFCGLSRFAPKKRIPRSFERLAKRPTRQNRVASYVFPSFIRLRKRLLRLKNARAFQHEEHLRAIRLYSIGVYYSLDVVLLLATGILPEKEPVHFHFMHNVKAAELESIRQPAQRRREIRGASDADLASTSAESPPARKPCVHQSKKVG